jgi:CRISPR-associated endonuclease Csy4
MMKVYIDITLLPSDDIGHHFLWEKVYQQLHIALAENQGAHGVSTVAVALPEYNAEKRRLGRKIRIFAHDREVLARIDFPSWLSRLSDYVHLTGIRDVPENVSSHERFTRRQVKSSPERLARRAAKRKGISLEAALKEREGVTAKKTDIPFVWTKSLTNESRFRLFIDREECPAQDGSFNAYGLSKGGCTPMF